VGDGLKMAFGFVVGALLVLLLVGGFSGGGMGYGMMGGGALGMLFALTFWLLVVALLAAVAIAFGRRR
jgi:hypothetical protein